MTDSASPPSNQSASFPTPPTTNLQPDSLAQPTIDAVIAQSLIQNNVATPPPPPTPTSSLNKESAPPRSFSETAPMVEINETEPLPPEVEGWLQKLDAAGDIKLPEPITHDGDILLAGSEAQVVKNKIVLPMSQTDVSQGLTAKVTDSARWLAEWCIRLVKVLKTGVKYAPESIMVDLPESIHGKT